MKYVRILGLVAAAAMAVMAFGGGTASAAQLCANAASEANGCGKNGTQAKAETAADVTGTSTNAILTSSITDVTCTDSHTTINPNSSTGTPITGTVDVLTFGGECETSGGTECHVTTVNLPYEASIEGTTLTVKDAVGAGAVVECGFLINCTFTTKEAKLSITNGTPTTATASKVVLNRSGGFCPATAEWHATYSTTSPAGLTVK